ncbi:MAG: alpha/beta hydrolase [Erysipelotrichaceae bacterium]|nr:alpha/beta hydrolase [Erysipelotrichaceae bacterium]
MNIVVYIHGKGGNINEAKHYRQLFPSYDVIGIDYKSSVPWEAREEIHNAILDLKEKYEKIILIANSIGTFFTMNADIEKYLSHAYFISPIVDMEKLIVDMMNWTGISESYLKDKGIVHTDFGEDLSWEYLCYVRKHPIKWSVSTDILYGSKDNLTSLESMTAFVKTHHASLTIMEDGEHWFHTEEQMQFLDQWIRNCIMKGINRL